MEPNQPMRSEEVEAFIASALERAEALRKEKQFDEGIHLLVEALQHQIDRAAIYFRLGNLYIDKGDLDRAEYAYKRTLEVDPDHAHAMNNLAVVYKRQKKVHLFVKTYKQAQRKALRAPSPTRGATPSSRAASFLRRGSTLRIVLFVVAAAAILWLVLRTR